MNLRLNFMDFGRNTKWLSNFWVYLRREPNGHWARFMDFLVMLIRWVYLVYGFMDFFVCFIVSTPLLIPYLIMY